MSDLDDQMIELTIEALTGTVYDLCVSPFETILGIKMKIQRLEGIPVYQQQLVHGNTELHDEFCLEEYSIGSGAQLKLLLAMRGGPIHAHRVQLEDPTLLEIAEVLEDQDFDHKYTVMLLRDGDTLDMADFVQVVADESPGHVSPLPQTTSSEQETTSSSLALSKVTRNKMQDLMCRLRSRKQMSQSGGVSIEPSGSHLHRRGAKVLILDSRSSSRLLHSTAPSPVTPHPRATPTQNPSTVHRKLVFPAEEKDTHTINNSGKCDGSSVEEGVHPRHHKAAELDSEHQLPPQQQTSHRQQSRVCPQQSSEPYQTTLRDKQSDRQQRHWRMKRRLRRPSCLQDNNTVPHHKDGELIWRRECGISTFCLLSPLPPLPSAWCVQ
jgi:AN1-type zinc finger and ubiquitin domain-containing protein 1